MADNDRPTDDTRPPPAEDRAKRGGLPRWVKIVLLLVLIAVAVVVLFTTVFPWVEERMQDPTMGAVGAPWMARLNL